MALFTVEADGQPICTLAAADLNAAEKTAEAEHDDWVEIGALPDSAAVSVREASLSEALFSKEQAAEAVDEGLADDEADAEDSVVAFHVAVSDGRDEEDDLDDVDGDDEEDDEGV